MNMNKSLQQKWNDFIAYDDPNSKGLRLMTIPKKYWSDLPKRVLGFLDILDGIDDENALWIKASEPMDMNVGVPINDEGKFDIIIAIKCFRRDTKGNKFYNGFVYNSNTPEFSEGGSFIVDKTESYRIR